MAAHGLLVPLLPRRLLFRQRDELEQKRDDAVKLQDGRAAAKKRDGGQSGKRRRGSSSRKRQSDVPLQSMRGRATSC